MSELTSSQQKLLAHPVALCNMVRRIAYQAGEMTLEYFDEAGLMESDIDRKADNSPVTKADQVAEDYIEEELLKIFPNIPVVGEEGTEAGKDVSLENADYFWLVDPLDGTKEFISGSGDYTVNIALIHNGDPVLGVIYAPVLGELYAGAGAGTAYMWREETNKEKELQVRRPPEKGLTVISSRSHGSSQEMEKFLEGYKVSKMIKRGSSLKICAIAAGKADIYPRLAPTCEWDIAAGDAILRAAGGIITDLDDKPMTYGHADRKFLNPHFMAKSF